MVKSSLVRAGSAALLLAACGPSSPSSGRPTAVAPSAPPTSGEAAVTPAPAPATAGNPLIAPWTGPYGGIPRFTGVKIADFRPAFDAAMNEERAKIADIAADPAAPTFENTIAKLEETGRTLDRVYTYFNIWASTMASPEFQAVQREMAPILSAYQDELTQNEAIFKRVEAVYSSADKAKLTPEQQRLTWRRYTALVRAGAKLDEAAKKRMVEINQRLASLYTNFGLNVLADEEGYATVLETEADTAGLPDAVKAAAAAEAANRGQAGKWVITNTRSSAEPFLVYSSRPDLREKVWKNFVNRGDNGGDKDTNKIIFEILKLRFERAQLLGYKTHAHWRLEDAMAKTPERADELMAAVWKPAVARVKEEVKEMLPLAKKEEKGKKVIEPWDYRYYAEKVRKAKYDLAASEVQPYLQLEKLREGMFWVAGELFGFAFAPVEGLDVVHPDVRVWEVKDRTSGKHIGLWYFDPYARQGKRSGAWMNAYRSQERFRGEITTIVSNNSNFVKGAPGEPVLISLDDAHTLFHEFGHALHGLSSNVTYPSLAGTSVARDYVEFPSQLLEHWLLTPEVLNRFALHVKTGEPMPQALVDKIEKAATFNQGFQTVEYLSSALVDMRLHLAGGKDIDADKFEKDTLKALGMPKEIVMRHRTPQFGHVFGGDGYSAGYYSYLWSDTLTASAWEAFTEAGGAYDKAVAARLKDNVFATGDTIDPADGFKAFRGGEAGIEPLLRKRGFLKAKAKKPAAKKTASL
jgi:peptidyl-dipeptidase Dcp